MDFGLSDDQALFEDALGRYLAERLPTARVRTVMESESGRDDDVLAGLAEQGVMGVLIDESYGGSGLTLLDAVVAAEQLGRAAAPVSFHSTAVMASLLLSASPSTELRRRWLPEIASGRVVAALITEGVEVVDATLNGVATSIADGASADLFLVAARVAGDGLRIYAIPSDQRGIAVAALATVDQTRRVADVTFSAVSVAADVGRGAGELAIEDSAGALERVLDAGRIALAADALGAAERSLELAVAYSLDRKQFGRRIGSFQAVKHMCAEVVAEVEPLRALVWYAAFAWDEQAADAPYAAALAKSHGAEVATEATTTCVQVFGGMGFTYDCDVQLWFQRAAYDRQMLGTPTALRERAAAHAFD